MFEVPRTYQCASDEQLSAKGHEPTNSTVTVTAHRLRERPRGPVKVPGTRPSPVEPLGCAKTRCVTGCTRSPTCPDDGSKRLAMTIDLATIGT